MKAWALLLLLVGCGPKVPPPANYPQQTDLAVPPALPAPSTLTDGWVAFEKNWRDDPFSYGPRSHPVLRDYKAKQKLLYPRTHDPGAARQMLAMGRDALAANEPAAAAQAFWGARALVSETFGPLGLRERIKHEAYEGLAEVARIRGQEDYAWLLSRLADLAERYVKSRAARENQQAFFEQLRQIEADERRTAQALAEARQAKRGAAVGAVFAGLAAASSAVGTGMAQGVNDPNAAAYQKQHDQNLENLEVMMEKADVAAEQFHHVQGVANLVGNNASEFRGVVASEIPQILAGQPFVADEIANYVATSEDPRGALTLLEKASAGRPQLQDLLEQVQRGEADLGALHEHLLHLERFVAQFERRGVTPDREAFEAMCGAGDALGCLTVGSGLCGKGDAEICYVLGGMYESGEVFDADAVAATRWFARACEAGEAQGCAKAAAGATGDQRKELLAKACDGGNVGACGELGGLLLAEGDRTGAQAPLQRACDGGDAVACVRVGALLGKGGAPALAKGCSAGQLGGCAMLAPLATAGSAPPEVVGAAWQAGCRAGVDMACGLLGAALITGVGLPARPAGAKPLLEASCGKKDPHGCYGQGMALARGIGGYDRDEERARSLLWGACTGGVPAACAGFAELVMSAPEARPIEAEEAWRRACAGGVDRGCAALPGLEPGQDPEQACAGRNPVEACRVSGESALGMAMPKRALDLFVRGCNGGDPLACKAQGDLQRDNRHSVANPPAAGLAYRKACERGMVQACALGAETATNPRANAQLLERGCIGGDAMACLEAR